jgi:hypothetical protein
MPNQNSDQTPARHTDPGVTSWSDGETTDADQVAGDLRTETGEQLFAETGQDGEPLEEARPKG